MIPHNRPAITAGDRARVDAVLASCWIAQGVEVSRLEESLVKLNGGGSACAVANGTTALFLALRGAGATRGDEVAVPSYACSALLNAVFMCDAVPRVVDVQPDTFCIDADSVRSHASSAAYVIAVHTFGAVADVAAVRGRCHVVEDCCQAIGGSVDGEPLGARGDAAVFSFYATKIVVGGQGGAVWSMNQSIVDSARDYREFDGRAEYAPRFNVQMTDLQAALVHSQLERLEAIRARRQAIAAKYVAALPAGLSVQRDLLDSRRMAHRVVVIAPDRPVRDALRDHMASAGIDCRIPIERFELLHRYMMLDPGSYPISERLADTTLSLPLHLSLTDDDVERVAGALATFA